MRSLAMAATNVAQTGRAAPARARHSKPAAASRRKGCGDCLSEEGGGQLAAQRLQSRIALMLDESAEHHPAELRPVRRGTVADGSDHAAHGRGVVSVTDQGCQRGITLPADLDPGSKAVAHLVVAGSGEHRVGLVDPTGLEQQGPEGAAQGHVIRPI
jgi:hypothetical protein